MRVALQTTAADGTYALPADLAQLDSSYFEPNGSVMLEVQATSGSSSLSDFLSAAQSGTAAATEGQVAMAGRPAAVTFDLAAGTVANSLGSDAPASDEDGAAAPSLAPAFTVPQLASRPSLTAGMVDTSVVRDNYQGRDPGSCSLDVPGARVPARPEHFVNVYSWSGGPGTVTETTSNSQSLGTAISVNGSRWAARAAVDRTTDTGSAARRTFSSSNSVSNLVNYRHFVTSCVTAAGTTSYDRILPTTYHALEVPALDKSRAMPNWGTCITYKAGDHVSKSQGKNERYSAGIDLGVVSVSAYDTFTNNMRIDWDPTAKSFFCGSNGDGPVGAPKALVKKWVDPTWGGCGPQIAATVDDTPRC